LPNLSKSARPSNREEAVPFVKTAVRTLISATIVLAIAAAPASAAKPRNTQQPSIFGTPIVGQTLTCEVNGWSGSPTFTFQWVRDAVPIEGATKSTYVIQKPDAFPITDGDPDPQIGCVVTGRNAEGATSAKSNTTAVVFVNGDGNGTIPPPVIPKWSEVVTLASAKKCVRFRRLAVKTKRPSGVEITGLTFYLNNKVKKNFDVTKLGTSITLSNLAKSSTIKVQIDIKNAKPITVSRKYKMCKHD
jgi:hypothetical protein